ncbi:MAG: hypothetical protein ACI909_002747, partial [Planctomycetota bacterium]
MIRALLKRMKRPKQTRPKLYYDGAHDSQVLPSDSLSDSLIALEPRFMFDAAGVATGAEIAAETVAQEQAEHALDSAPEAPIPPAVVESTEKLFEALSLVDAPDNDTNEIIFIDTSIEDYETLLEGLDSNAEVIFLDANRDGVEQIAEVLEGRDDVDAIHIIAHGDAGQLQLGNTILTEESMQGEHADELALINSALSENADILIYGCNFAEGDFGLSAAEKLAELTGADIAASDDLTGAAELGGDWDLETKVGSIETDVFASAEALESFSGTLVAVTLDSSATAQVMVDTMSPSGNGLTITNPDIHAPPGDPLASGTFSNGTAAGLDIDSGIVFTTGRLTDMADNSDNTNDLLSTNNTNLNSDDTELDTVLTNMGITNGNQVDRSEFTHNFIANSGITKIAFQYVVGTDTDMSTVSNTSRVNNDAFGIFMTTDLNGSSEPNNGAPWTTVAADSLSSLEDAGAFVNGFVEGEGTEFDNVTNAQSAVATVLDDGTEYYMKFELADMSGSTGNDTAVFLSYFGSSIFIDADGDDSSGATNSDYQADFDYDPASTGISIVDTVDAELTNHDTTNITSATISIGTGFTSGDVLNFSNTANITGSYDSVTGVLTLSGSDTAANYLAALESTDFNTTSITTGARAISIVVNDGETDSNTATSTITVLSVNEVPNSQIISDVFEDDGATITTIDASTDDPNGVSDTLTYGIVGAPSGLSINASGQITGILAANDSSGGPSSDGVYTITVTATDIGGLSTSYDITLVVSNPAPTDVTDFAAPAALEGTTLTTIDAST